jgi:DNA-binding transcriptional LysR family regulator
MTLRQVAYLLAVADMGSFTAAARRMHVSQPSLSQQIRALEAELGGPLLDRPPRPVRLTAAGRAFVAEGRTALTAARRATDAARATMNLEVRELRVATVRSLAVSQLPGAIKRWQASHPGLTVHLKEYAHRNLVAEAVLEGTSELGIAPRPATWPGVVARLGWDELVVVLPGRGGRAARRRRGRSGPGPREDGAVGVPPEHAPARPAGGLGDQRVRRAQ